MSQDLGLSSYQLVDRNQLGTLPLPPGEPVQPDGPLEIVESIDVLPTGLQTGGPYVDLKCDVFKQRIYLTKDTVWEAAKLFGFVEGDAHADVCVENDALAAELERLQAELKQFDDMRNIVAALSQKVEMFSAMGEVTG